MSLLKLLLSISIICTATMTTVNPIDEKSSVVEHNAFNYFLSGYSILPLYYKMKLRILDNYFSGNCIVTIHIINATQTIYFHIPDSMSIIKPELKSNGNGVIYKTISINYDKNLVIFNFDNVLLPGMYSLYIEVFEIPINILRESFGTPYTNEKGDKVWLIATGIKTRKQQIFPFWKKPELKITFEISIFHHQRYTILPNMPIKKFHLKNISNDIIVTYLKTKKISIDNVAFVMYEFHRINLTDTISMWCKPQLIPYVDFALHIIKNVTVYLENYWNNSKKVLVLRKSKMKHVAIPNLQDEIEQSLRFVFHREADIIYVKKLDPVARKMLIASLVAHRTIHKYIGNMLNPFYWSRFDKGFIMFLQTYIIDKVVPNFRMMELFIVQVQHELLDLNIYFDMRSGIEYDNYSENYAYTLFSQIFFNKDFIIWRMLKRTLSSSKFLKIINVYLNEHAKPEEKTFNNLWKAMESIDEFDDIYDYKYYYNVQSTVYSWTMQRCFPVLEVKRNNFSDVVTISAQFYKKLDKEKYYIPITYTTESESNFTITWSNISLTPSKSEIEIFLKKDQWIILNLQQAGYYRVNYDIENWQKIARYLNSEEYKNIHVLNRAQIIDDAFHFAVEKKLKSSIFWELASYLRKEKDYIAWYPMLKAFEFMSNIFPLLTVCPHFQKMPLELMWNVYSEDSDDDHMECLKQELAKWKCITHDISCRRNASEQLQRHLNKEIKLSPGWKKWTYCNGLRTADLFFWEIVYQNIEKEIDYTILECLAYTEYADTIIWFLKKRLPNMFFHETYQLATYYQHMQIIEQNDTLIANIFLSSLMKNSERMLEFLLYNFREIVPRHVSKVTALAVIINNSYTKENLNRIQQFVEKEIKGPIFSDVERKIETRWSQIERQIIFFQSLID